MSIHSANAQDRFWHRTFCFSLVTAFLLVTAHRLPAPIQEVPESPTPAPAEQAKPKKAPSKSKRVESESDARSGSAQRFNGTWKGTKTKKRTLSSGSSKGDYVYTFSYTLIIKGGNVADLISEVTLTPPSGGAIYVKATNHSDNLVVAGSTLIIRFAGGRLLDWQPKTLPRDEVQFYAESETSTAASVFTLKGNELVAGGGAVYHRVK